MCNYIFAVSRKLVVNLLELKEIWCFEAGPALMMPVVVSH